MIKAAVETADESNTRAMKKALAQQRKELEKAEKRVSKARTCIHTRPYGIPRL